MSLEMRILLLLTMLFAHIIADYNLQGVLASMKQASWWEKRYDYRMPRMYRKDYRMALFEHAFSWTFVMLLPVTFLAVRDRNGILGWIIVALFVPNVLFHSYVDHLKANKKSINLVADQLCHVFQVLISWLVCMAAL